MGGLRPTESDLEDSSDDDMYADDTSDDDDDDDDGVEDAPTRHRLEWDNDI